MSYTENHDVHLAMHRLYRAVPLIFFAVVAFQIFLPPVIGLADNGDFGKVTGDFCLVPVENPAYTSEYNYFVSLWRYDSSRCLPTAFITSQKAMTFLATVPNRVFSKDGNFDVRWLGALQLIVCAFGVAGFCRAFEVLPSRIGLALCGFAMLVMTDVAYFSYFNTFYTDAVAVAAFFAVMGLSLYLALAKDPSTADVLLTLGAAALYVGSKAQHAFAGFLFAGFLLLRSGRLAPKPRLAARFSAAFLAILTVIMYRSTPELYKIDPLFSVIFLELAGRAQDPVQELAGLGLGPEYAVAKGMYTFEDRWPANDVPWKVDVYHKAGGYGGLFRYYLKHPARTFDIVIRSMQESCRDIRPLLLANFRRQDGFAQGSQTRNFSVWTAMKRAVFWNYAPYLLLVYAAGIASAIWLWLRFSHDAGLWALMACLIGLGELAVATLCDACETSRHLFLFHAATDVVLGLLLGSTLSIRVNRMPRPDRTAP